MKYYTLKKFYEEEKNLEESGASDKAISKHRKIWDLASKGWELSKVGEERMKKAAALLRTVYKEWRMKDQVLEWDQYDNEYARHMCKYYDKKDDQQIEKLKKLCKELGLKLDMSTFAHVFAETKTGRREII